MNRPHPEASPGCGGPARSNPAPWSDTATRTSCVGSPHLELDVRGARVPHAVGDQLGDEQPDVLGELRVEGAVQGPQSADGPRRAPGGRP